MNKRIYLFLWMMKLSIKFFFAAFDGLIRPEKLHAALNSKWGDFVKNA